MSVLTSGFGFLITLIFNIYIFILLLRLLMQKQGVRWHNPITQFVIAITDPIVKPVRKFIPGYRGYDLAILALCFVLEILEIIILMTLTFDVFPHLLGVLIIAIGELGMKVTNIYFYATIIAAIMSWFPALQQGPVAEIVISLTEPLFRFARRYIPLLGGLDLSPIIIILGLMLLNAVFFKPIIAMGTRLLM